MKRMRPKRALRPKPRAGDLAEFLKFAQAKGARDAKLIYASSVRCEAWVRMKCQFGCGGYGKRLSCPPFTPKPEETAAVVACYKRAILIHCRDNDEVNQIIPHLERAIFLAGYYKALGLGSGPCHYCDRCNVKSRCVHPYLARPSMEACGIDVYATARANGFTINVVRSYREQGDYFGLVLVE
jgi:predicted metal-binding protein